MNKLIYDTTFKIFYAYNSRRRIGRIITHIISEMDIIILEYK